MTDVFWCCSCLPHSSPILSEDFHPHHINCSRSRQPINSCLWNIRNHFTSHTNVSLIDPCILQNVFLVIITPTGENALSAVSTYGVEGRNEFFSESPLQHNVVFFGYCNGESRCAKCRGVTANCVIEE